MQRHSPRQRPSLIRPAVCWCSCAERDAVIAPFVQCSYNARSGLPAGDSPGCTSLLRECQPRTGNDAQSARDVITGLQGAAPVGFGHGRNFTFIMIALLAESIN